MPTGRTSPAAEPRITAVPLLERSRGRALSLLQPDEAAQLAALGEAIELRKGDLLYRAKAPADSIFNLVQGVAKTVQARSDDGVLVTRFLFPGDVCGLTEQGHYIETAEAITASVAWRIPFDAVVRLMQENGPLAFRLFCRAAHDLRESQRQAQILVRKEAVGRIAMFLDLLSRAELARGPGGTAYLPMSRSDIADFVGLTIEATSRAFSLLDRLDIVSFVDRHHFNVLDRARLQALTEGAGTSDLAPKKVRRQAK